MTDGEIKIQQDQIRSLKLPINVLKQGSQVLIYSPALELCSSGDDREQAAQNFHDAVLIFLEDLVEQGTLDDVLEELGWIVNDTEWIPPAWECNQYQSIDVTTTAM